MLQRPSQVPPIALVIDDDQGLCDVLAEALGDTGYKVLALQSPPEHDEVRRLAPDLIVLDLMFRGAPVGCAFARDLKNHPGTASTPVIAISASSEVEALKKELRAVDALLVKPFDLDVLEEAVLAATEARACP